MRREQYEITSDGKNIYIGQNNDLLDGTDGNNMITLSIEQIDTFIEDLKKIAVPGGQ
jgi:hypothetical protein